MKCVHLFKVILKKKNLKKLKSSQSMHNWHCLFIETSSYIVNIRITAAFQTSRTSYLTGNTVYKETMLND